MSRCASSFRPAFNMISMRGSPICEWRASSGLHSLQHRRKTVIAVFFASADSAMNCRFVKPCSNEKFVMIAELTASRGVLDVVEAMPFADHDPVVGIGCLVRPIERTVLADEFVSEKHLDLRMSRLIETAERCHVAHARRFSEAGHSRERRNRSVFDKRN